MILNNILSMMSKRRILRNNMTEEELILWSELKHSKLNGYKFRRQHSIGYYILDFYCPQKKIGIELDGTQHYQNDNFEYDQNRDAFLKACGVIVLRFTNIEVKKYLLKVINRVSIELENRVDV